MWLDMYIEKMNNDIINSQAGETEHLTRRNDALLSLLHNDNIVIRLADKGSGILVLDNVKYIESLQKEME